MYEDSNDHILTNTCYFPLFYFLVILVSVTWYHIVALICISLTINDVGYIFMCFLVLCHAQLLSHIWLFETLRDLICQAPPSMGFFMQEY